MDRRICVVGAGRWGRNHIRTLRELSALGGVTEPGAEARAEVEKAFPGTPVYADLDAALEADFDGFVLATPAETHHALARRILEAGRPCSWRSRWRSTSRRPATSPSSHASAGCRSWWATSWCSTRPSARWRSSSAAGRSASSSTCTATA